jgi:hypothetical protein
MVQKNEVLTLEGNSIPLISTGGTLMQEGYPIITEIQIPVNTTEQTWIFEVGEKARTSRTTPGLVDTLVKVIKWLNLLGSGKIDDSRLEARHNIHHNFRINRIGL